MPITLEDFFAQYKILEFDKNQVIIHADDMPAGVYYIKSGFVKKCIILENGKELTLRIYREGTFFPIIWAITNIANNYFFKTATSVQLQRASRDDLISFIQKDPKILYELLHRILINEQELFNNITHELTGNSYQRTIATLVLSARRFGEKHERNKIRIELPMTHQEIADMAGITRESVSLVMRKLTGKKIISKHHGKILIHDMKLLENESLIDQEEKPT